MVLYQNLMFIVIILFLTACLAYAREKERNNIRFPEMSLKEMEEILWEKEKKKDLNSH